MSASDDANVFLNAILEAKRTNNPHYGRLAIQNFINGSVIASQGRYDAVSALTWVLFESISPPNIPAASNDAKPVVAQTPAPAAPVAAPPAATPFPLRMAYKEFLMYAKATPLGVDKWLKLIGRSKNNPFTPKDIEDYHKYRHAVRVNVGKRVGSTVAERHGKAKVASPDINDEYDVPEDDVPGMLGSHWDKKQFQLQVLWQGGKHYGIKPEARMKHGLPFYRRADILAFKELINRPPAGTESNVAAISEARIQEAENAIHRIKQSIK